MSDGGGVVYGILIDVYIEKGFLDEVVFVIINIKDLVFDLLRCNYLLDVFLKRNCFDLFWDVYNEMVERSLVFDVYGYEKLIGVYCRGGNV